MESTIDLQEPDEARPAKRARLEAPLHITEDLQEEMIDDGDWDDIYGLNGDATLVANPEDGADGLFALPDTTSDPTLTADPTLGDLAQITEEQQHAADVSLRESGEAVQNGIPAEAIDNGDELVIEQQQHEPMMDKASASVMQETTNVEVQSPYRNESPKSEEKRGAGDLDPSSKVAVAQEVQTGAESTATVNGHGAAIAAEGEVAQEPLENPNNDSLQPTDDPKPDEEAEWRFDPSDAESSDSDDSSDSSSDDSEAESEDGYEMLDPATAAKILMSGEGDDDDGDKTKGKAAGDHQPRTANEKKEEVVPKPDVAVTEDMKITYLGTVDRNIGSQILIKAVTPGEYQVLEYGSVLCTEGRQVIGAVSDTMGRVQEPMYSVSFTNAQEIEESGLVYGTKIFYVDSHSSFVFTQPLKSMKGTDASNIHDEEVGEDELEFSDDEKEAEFKSLRKAAKKEGRAAITRGAYNQAKAAGGFSFGAPGYDGGQTYVNTSDVPQQQYGGGLNYDDVDAPEELYSPLKRPDNFSQLMAGGGPPRPAFDRGRGRGRARGDRGRGRGDRGRGRGGFDRGQRGGRGNYDQDRGRHRQQNEHRGNAHSFPDRHNDYMHDQYQKQSLPPKPPALQGSPSQQQQQYAAYPPYPSPQAYNPQSYQFNGYTFQYGNSPVAAQQANNLYNQQPQQQSPTAHSPDGSLPAGSFVNPAFYQGQQQWPQSQQPNYNGWQQSPPNAGLPVAMTHGPPGQSSDNLAEILRQLGGQQQQQQQQQR